MLFAHLKQMTEKNLECPVSDCVIGIPSYFTDFQRREYLTAASMAGLKPLKLMHDCTAIALGYGMYKSDFSNKGPTNVIFVDIGHSDTQVTVAAFEQGKMTILSHSFDQHLGGRDFDEVLFRHFAVQFKEKYNLDVYSNARASTRLRASCEKLKKVLSANAEAPLSIECLIDEKDVNGFITREEFENLSQELLERVAISCCKALSDSGLSVDKIHSIELVGSGSRIPAIMRILTLVFHKEPVRTLNGSECVARGCALGCAMLSPTCHVQDYKVQDFFPYSIGLCFDDGKYKKQLMPFLKGSQFPTNITVSYHRHTTFDCQVFYTKNTDFPAGVYPEVGYFMIGPPKTSGPVYGKVTVNIKLNIHGIVEIESALLLKDSYLSSNNSLLHSLLSRPWTRPRNLMTDDAMAEETRRGNGRRQNLAISENCYTVITTDELREAQEKEKMLADQDINVEKTKEKRNTLESFIYETRSKVSSLYRSVATDSEVDIIFKSLQETEEWLYEEGDDESEQVYIRKLEDLGKLLDPIKNRYKDEKARKEAIKALQTCLKEKHLAANSLPPCQKKEVDNECILAEQWLNYLSKQQDSLRKSAAPIYCLSALTGITKVFNRRCKDVTTSKALLPKNDEPMDLD